MSFISRVDFLNEHHEDQTDTYNITWTIVRFSDFLKHNTSTVYVTKKSERKDDSFRIELKMGIVGKFNDLFELYYLCPVTAFVKSYLTMRTYEHQNYGQHILADYEFQPVRAHTWTYLTGISKYQLMANRDTYFSDDTLHLSYKFVIARNVKVQLPNEPKENLRFDLERLLKCGQFADVIIKSSQGTQYKVHKNVISCRSVVLNAHFEHNTQERYTNIIESRLDDHILIPVLIYIYTDLCPDIERYPEQIFVAADYYQLHELKRACEKVIFSKITIENAAETYLLADLHSASYLKKSTLEFMKQNPLSMIESTLGWKKIKSEDQLIEIYQYLACNHFELVYV